MTTQKNENVQKHIKNKSVNLFTQTLPYNSKSSKVFKQYSTATTKNATKSQYLFDNKENSASTKLKKPKRATHEPSDKADTPTFYEQKHCTMKTSVLADKQVNIISARHMNNFSSIGNDSHTRNHSNAIGTYKSMKSNKSNNNLAGI